VRRIAVAAVAVVACIACYGGNVLPAPDDAPPPVRDAGAVDVSDGSASTNEGGAVVEAGTSCDGGACTRYVFVTSAVVKGDFGGGAMADTICKQAASTSSLLEDRVFRAWLSQPGVDARMRFGPINGEQYVRVDGVVVAKSLLAVADGTLEAPIDRDEGGGFQEAVRVWTGTSPLGGAAAKTCLAWSTNGTGETGLAGGTEFSDGRWTQYVDLQCSQEAHLYCIEDD
jgi:hypothetical protein